MQGLCIFLLFVVFQKIAALVPGFTTAGTHFVFSCVILYGKRYNASGVVYITSENVATGTITDTTQTNPEFSHFRVSKDSSYSFTMKADLCGFYHTRSNGIYPVFILKSSSPVTAIQESETNEFSMYVAFKLIPEQSCYRKYYVATARGYPIIMVFSFEKATQIVVQFPFYADKFNFDCAGNHFCKSNSTVTVNLGGYKVWQLAIHGYDYDFHNTLITSNQPVFVISGSFRCRIIGHSNDGCVSSVFPFEAWGKQYILPNFFGNSKKVTISLRFTVASFPFYYRIIKGKENNKKSLTQAASDVVLDIRYPTMITSNVPFGLYMFSPSMANGHSWDSAMTNLIPVEQWTSGLIYIPSTHDRYYSDEKSYFLLTNADPKTIIHRGSGISPKWKHYITVNGTTFSTTSFDLSKGETILLTKNSPGRFIVYVRMFITVQWSGSSLHPYDYYQGKINTLKCKTYNPVASDGFDNDCDGFIDEEVVNGADDDGDGKIDEDTVEPYQDGEWADWTVSCHLTCGSTTIDLRRARSCSKKRPSRFGKRCRGQGEKCRSGPTCKNSCPNPPQKIETKCVCQSGCKACNASSSGCTGCKPGYFESKFCDKPCPRGWSGHGCSRGPRNSEDFLKLITTPPRPLDDVTTAKPDSDWPNDYDKFDTSEIEKENVTFPWISVVIPLLAIISGLLVYCVFSFVKKRRAANKPPDGTSAMFSVVEEGPDEVRKQTTTTLEGSGAEEEVVPSSARSEEISSDDET